MQPTTGDVMSNFEAGQSVSHVAGCLQEVAAKIGSYTYCVMHCTGQVGCSDMECTIIAQTMAKQNQWFVSGTNMLKKDGQYVHNKKRKMKKIIVCSSIYRSNLL